MKKSGKETIFYKFKIKEIKQDQSVVTISEILRRYS